MSRIVFYFPLKIKGNMELLEYFWGTVIIIGEKICKT